jgi:hypothetical protein
MPAPTSALWATMRRAWKRRGRSSSVKVAGVSLPRRIRLGRCHR